MISLNCILTKNDLVIIVMKVVDTLVSILQTDEIENRRKLRMLVDKDSYLVNY